MDFSLVLVQRDGSMRELPLQQRSRVVFGRQADCQVRLPDAAVSRQHCELVLDSGTPVLKDLGSSNGTYVNRRRVSQTELAAGDLIAIGPFVFVVRIGGEPATVVAADVLEAGAMADPAPSGTTPLAAPGGSDKAARAAKPQASGFEREPATRVPDPDDSDEFDFDFLDDDKDAPKL